MKSEKILNELKELAEKINITVSEQNLKASGICGQSGLCKVKDEDKYLLEKKLPIRDKVELLADCLCTKDTSGLYVKPQIRDILAKYAKKKSELKNN